MLEITSPTNPRIKAIAKLADKKHRAETGLFMLEGERYVQAALAAGWEAETIVALEGSDVDLRGDDIVATSAVLSRITGKDNPQPVLGVLNQRWSNLPDTPKGVVLVLDRIRDPGNLGTIIRTADACAVECVVLVGDCCDSYAPECVRATVGSILHVPLVKVSEAEFIAWAKRQAMPILGTIMDGETDYRKAPSSLPLALVMGNESDGISLVLQKILTHCISIPMRGHTESLNVATAAAVVLYALRQSDVA